MSVEDSLSENNPAMDEQKKAGAKKKAKKMDKTNLVSPGAPAEEGDKGPDSESGEASDNAFVTVVMKKIRAYRKKLERAKALEAQEQAGKALVEDQKVLLANKTSIEKMLKELEGIKQQMVEVAKEEVKARRVSELVPDHEEAPGAVDAPDSPASRSVETIENETQTVEVEGEPVPKPEPEVVKVEVPVPTDPTEHVDRLLRLLHVYGRTHELKTPFTELHGVDLLAKTILGQTSPIESDFEQTLAQSVKRAVYYLNTDVREFTNGVTYEQMEVRVNELAATLQGPATEAMDNKRNEEREYHHIIFGTVDGAARPQEPSGQQPGLGTEHIVANPFESQWTGDLSSPITTPSLNNQARELPAPQASLQQLLQLPPAPVSQDRDQHELQQQQEPEAAEVLGNGVSHQDSSGDDQAQDQQQQVKAKGERRGENGSGRERGGRGSSGRARRPRTGQQSREGRGSSGSGDGEGRPYRDQQQQRDQPRQPRPQPRQQQQQQQAKQPQQQQQQHGGESTRANGGTQERYQRSGSKGEGGGRAGGVRGGGSGASRGGGGSGGGGRAGRPRVERGGGGAPQQQQHQQHGEAARSN